jgi:hypothetical protein
MARRVAAKGRSQGPTANLEVVTLAVYLLGGDTKRVDTEDIAIKANELAPGRFVWKKYPEQVNLEIVRVYLSDAKKPDKGGFLLGSGSDGWQLSERGLSFARSKAEALEGVDLSRAPLSARERQQRQMERTRISTSDAFSQYQTGGRDRPTLDEIEAMFRVNAYVRGKARERKVTRIVNTFGDDPEIGKAVTELAERLKEEGEPYGD